MRHVDEVTEDLRLPVFAQHHQKPLVKPGLTPERTEQNLVLPARGRDQAAHDMCPCNTEYHTKIKVDNGV